MMQPPPPPLTAPTAESHGRCVTAAGCKDLVAPVAFEVRYEGCRDGLPLMFSALVGTSEPSLAEATASRDKAWARRKADSGACLLTSAYVWSDHDIERARTLAALGFVRGRWEAIRCGTPETPGSGGYRVMLSVTEAALGLQPSDVYKPTDVWRKAVRAIALDPATYRYDVDMAKVCEPSPVRPETEWPVLREALRAKIVDAADKEAKP